MDKPGASRPGAPHEADGTDGRLLLLSDADNVLLARQPIAAGETILVSGIPIHTEKDILLGHKVARRAIAENEKVRKYGAPIGSATRAIEAGEHVHVHNMKSDYTRTHVIDASDEEKSR